MWAKAARLTLRQLRIAGRQRHASTTAQAADAASSTATKSKEAASNVTSKASQGLTRVTSSAGPVLSRAGQGLSSALGKIGGRTGRLISFAECDIDTSNDILHESRPRTLQDSLSRAKDEPTVSDLGFPGKHSDGQPFHGRGIETNDGMFQELSCLPILFAASSKSHPATGNIIE
ncbi:MAG: hypothetical protein LQ337_001200 [Flavoplaca oasis]|nr:MAG: hypothetical protein LQ337_001200 [Flavoplaca oasis]